MSIDDVIREEVHAETAIRQILVELQDKLKRRVDWVKVDVQGDMRVTVNTKAE